MLYTPFCAEGVSPFERHTWAEIDLDVLRENFAAIRRRAGGLPLCAVVKADAYGHGDVVVAKTLAAEGAAWFAVSCLSEALHLRKNGIAQPILILGHTDPAFACTLAAQHITQACFSLRYAKMLSDIAGPDSPVEVHLKADTGMGRIGFALRADFDKAVCEMLECFSLPGLSVTGLFQHFAVADEASEASQAYTAAQHTLFCHCYAALEAAGHAPQLVHCDNSAGVMLHPGWPEGLPRSRCMARPGIILYGFDPSGEVRFHTFRPVMKLKTVVSMIKTLAPGESTSYGRHFIAEKPTRVATLCVGYADGYPRLLSCGKGVVEIAGRPAPILGSICMDQCMVDVTGMEDVHPGDEVTVWGGSFGDSAESIAEKTGTISYEVLCGVSRRVPRVYVEHGSVTAVADFLND